jgi:ABC-type nitrate/sulfonate/bicarbonate transport system substrate-binding protein
MLRNLCRWDFLLLVTVSLLLGCSTQSKEAADTGKKPLAASLRLKWIYDPGFAGEMIAAKEGFFSSNGLDLQLKPGGFEADPIKLVASGSDTFGVAGADSFLLARAKGVPIVAFAAGYLQTPVVFYVHADSGISSPQDFVGRKIGYQAGQDTATVYEALIKKLALPRSRIKEIPIRYDFTPFLTRAVDVWPGYAATQSYVLEQRKIPYAIIKPSNYGLGYLGTVYFTSERFLSEHPEAVQAFLDGLIRGWEQTYSDQVTTTNVISSCDPKTLTPELIRFNLDKQKEFILPTGSRYCDFSMVSWQALNQSLVELKLLSEQVNLGTAVNLSFLNKHYHRATSQ